jgi:hypothetical protein
MGPGGGDAFDRLAAAWPELRARVIAGMDESELRELDESGRPGRTAAAGCRCGRIGGSC